MSKKIKKFFVLSFVAFIVTPLSLWASCNGQTVRIGGTPGEYNKVISDANRNCCAGDVIHIHNVRTNQFSRHTVAQNGFSASLCQ